MKYRTKLFSFFAIWIFLTNSIFFAIFYHQAQNLLLSQINSTVLSIAATAATMVDGDEHAHLTKPADMNSALYEQLVQKLRKIRDANRRSDIYVKFIYTVAQDSTKQNQLVYGLDAEEDGKDKSAIGDLVSIKNHHKQAFRFNMNAVIPTFIEDQWGKWLTANSPIYDKNGNLVAGLRVDVSSADVLKKIHWLLATAGIALLLVLIIEAIFFNTFSRRFKRGVNQIRLGLQAILDNNYQTTAAVLANDELGELAQLLNQVSAELQQRQLVANSTNIASPQVNVTSGQKFTLVTESKKLSVLFGSLSLLANQKQQFSSENANYIINEWLEKIISIINSHHGQLYQFANENFAIIFGLSSNNAKHEYQAIKAALELETAYTQLTKTWSQQFNINAQLFMGIHTEQTYITSINQPLLNQLAILTDIVEKTSQVAAYAKANNINMVITEATYQPVQDVFAANEIEQTIVLDNSVLRIYSVSNS